MAAANNLPDQLERQRALDPEGSFIVQAPAGAGKTELLTRRLLALLARVERPEAILALTFTKKAAAEMRDRVLSALRGPGPDGTPLSPEVEVLVAAVRRRDQDRGWHLADNPARLRLQTIDAFTAGLAAQVPLGSGLAGRTVQEKAGPVYRQAARALLRELDSSDPALAETRIALRRLLAHLDNHWPRAETLLAGLLPKREQWLPHAVGKAGDSAARQELEAALQKIIAAALARARAAIPSHLEEGIAALARYAASHVPAHPALAAGRDLAGWPSVDPDGAAGWAGIAALFLTGKDERRQRITVAEGFPAAGPDAQLWKERWKAAGAALSDGAVAALAAVRHLPAAQYTDAQWEVLAALLRLLPRAAALLEVEFQAAAAADFPAYTLAAAQALGSDEVPAEIAFAWDARLEHLLVDEFQDTSQGQFDLLLRLTRDWQGGDGRTVFLVGDPMQSIYGFRQARVGLFLRLWQERRWGGVELEPVRLTANFRSAPVLVGWFNRYLGAAFPAEPDALLEAVPYAPLQAAQADTPGAAARFHQLPWQPSPSGKRGRVDREAEAAEVVQLVRQARAAGESDIAILVRARAHAEAILGALAADGIATVEGLDHLGDRRVVRDLLALTRALLRPADRTAWLALLRAPWCGLALADLLLVAEGDGCIWDNCQNAECRKRLTIGGQLVLNRCRPVLERALEQHRRGPLRRLVEGTWIELGGPAARRHERADWQDAQAFLDLAESLEAAGGMNLEELESRVQGLRTVPEARDGAVRVMTMHQAKGLEFGTVILPGLDRPTASDARELLAWQEIPADAEGHADLLLAPIVAPGAEDPSHEYLRTLRRQQRDQEAIRLLYVAATRARRRLYLLAGWVPGKQPERRSLAALLAPEGVAPEPAVAVAPTSAQRIAGHEAEAKPRRLPPAWRLPAPPAAIAARAIAAQAVAAGVSFDWVRPLSRHIGNVVHAWLQAVAGREDMNAAPWSEAGIRSRLAQEGVSAGEMEAAAERVRRAMEQVLADERGRWLLARHQADQREWALAGTGSDGVVRHVRLDRSFVHEGARWIVDYKTGVHAGGGLARFLEEELRRYAPQLEGYAALVAEEEARPIQLGLYFPLIEENGRPAWRPWPYLRAAAASRLR